MNYTYYRRYRSTPRPGGKSHFKGFFSIVIILVALVFLLKACVSVLMDITADRKDEAVLTMQGGSAQIHVWGESKPQVASEAQVLHVEDAVETDSDSLATLTLYNGSELRLDSNTKLTLSAYQEATDGETELSESLTLTLETGRVWLHQVAGDDSGLEIHLLSPTMNLISMEGDHLMEVDASQEQVWSQSGNVQIDLVQRGDEEAVIESHSLQNGEVLTLTAADRLALLKRENIDLQKQSFDEVLAWDSFIRWNLGEESQPVSIVEELEEILPTEELAEASAPEEVLGLSYHVSSPSSGSKIEKSAIAIEGQIDSGTASKVMVTWSGTGQAYALSAFQPGSTTFRYVADVSYGNFAPGENTYTIVAYDENGVAGPPIYVKITGVF